VFIVSVPRTSSKHLPFHLAQCRNAVKIVEINASRVLRLTHRVKSDARLTVRAGGCTGYGLKKRMGAAVLAGHHLCRCAIGTAFG